MSKIPLIENEILILKSTYIQVRLKCKSSKHQFYTVNEISNIYFNGKHLIYSRLLLSDHPSLSPERMLNKRLKITLVNFILNQNLAPSQYD